MTLADIIREVGELAARSVSIQSDLKPWVNRAQRAIAQRRNWTFMHSQQSVTIPSGSSSAEISPAFKELSAEKSPITYTSSAAAFPTPVRVRSRQELEATAPNLNNVVTNAASTFTPFYVFLEQNDGGRWTINLPAGYTHSENAIYSISCYLFPDELVKGTDHNAITDDAELQQAIVSLTTAIALRSQDPESTRAEAARQQAERSIQLAIAQDARKRLAGRAIRM